MDMGNTLKLEGVVVGGRYRCQRRLGRGGMGEVWLAEDAKVGGRPIAIKFVELPGSEDDATARRFWRAVSSLSKVEAQQVVEIKDTGEWKTQAGGGIWAVREVRMLYLVMDYVQGATLEEQKHDKGCFTVGEAARALEDTLKGLSAMHCVDVIHRDIKPANIMFDDKYNCYRLTDFGLVRPEGPGDTVTKGDTPATASYMAPEVARCERATMRSDLFSTGVTIWELVAGRNPVARREGEMDAAYRTRRGGQNPAVPSLESACPGAPKAFSDFLARLTTFNPSDRPANAMEASDEFAAMRAALTPQDLAWRATGAAPTGLAAFPNIAKGKAAAGDEAPIVAAGPDEAPTVAWDATRGAEPTAGETGDAAPNGEDDPQSGESPMDEKTTASAAEWQTVPDDGGDYTEFPFTPADIDAVLEGITEDTLDGTAAADAVADSSAAAAGPDEATPTAGEAPIPVDEAHFPDPVFRAAVAESFDLDHDGILSPEEIAQATTFEWRGYYTYDEWREIEPDDHYDDYYYYEEHEGRDEYDEYDPDHERQDDEKISDIRGIEYLPALTTLDLENNLIGSIDLSHNPRLATLNLADNDLTSIDVSRNPDLAELRVDGNILTSIDVTHNPDLATLSVSGDGSMTSIDVSHNPHLTSLTINGARGLTGIDLGQCPHLTSLAMWNTGLESLDLSRNTELSSLSLVGARLTGIDLNHNSQLASLDVRNTPITRLDLSGHTALDRLKADGNTSLAAIDLSGCTALGRLEVNGNTSLARLDLSGCRGVTEPDLRDNALTHVILGDNEGISKLFLSNNHLTSVDVSGCKKLTWLHLDHNEIAEIDVSHNKRLTQIHLNDNRLTRFSTAGIRMLTRLDLSRNQLTEVDVHDCRRLTHLKLVGNPGLRQLIVAPGMDAHRMGTGLRAASWASLTVDEME